MPIVLLVIIALGLGSCLEPSHGKKSAPPPTSFALTAAVPSKLRGYEVINKIIQQRAFTATNDFKLVSYIEESTDENILSTGSAFIKLLGAHEGNGLSFDYQGRLPNTINMLLWYTIFGLFADDLANGCKEKAAASANLNGLTTDFQDLLCSARKQEAFDAGVWTALWETLIASDAPETEKEQWLNFVEQRFDNGIKEHNLLVEALTTMLMNPYFLIAH